MSFSLKNIPISFTPQIRGEVEEKCLQPHSQERTLTSLELQQKFYLQRTQDLLIKLAALWNIPMPRQVFLPDLT